MLNPKLVVVDEPSMSLDPRTLMQVFEALTRMHQVGQQTILLVEQNVRKGLEVVSSGVVMEGGRIRMQGLASEIRDNPEMDHLFFGGSLSGI